MEDHLRLVARGDRVYLELHSELDAPLSQVVGRVRQDLPGMHIDWVAVREAYRFGRGRSFPVATRRAEAAWSEKAKFRFSEDGLTAYLILYPPKKGGARLDEAEVFELAEAYGIPRDMIARDAVRRALLRRIYAEPEPVARGRPAAHGEPSRIEWAGGGPLDPEPFLRALERGGSVPDPAFLVAEPGQVVGAYHPPTPGEPGRSVRGQPIPPRPGQDRVRLGPGLGIAPDGRAVVAQAEGHVRVSGLYDERADLVPVLLVRGPQDLAPWRDDLFVGTVVVEGDLEVPFRVCVLGDVEVRGSLIRSPLEVTGSLFVRDGIIHARAVPLKVGGVVSAGFFERAHVAARVIHVRRYALKSSLTALDTVWIDGGGEVRGGMVAAGRRVRGGVFGTPNGLATRVEAATPRVPDAFLRMYASWAERMAQAGGEDADPLFQREAERWRNEADLLSPPEPLRARIHAEGVHPGVTVRMGTAVRSLENTLGPAEFAFELLGPRGRVSLTRL